MLLVEKGPVVGQQIEYNYQNSLISCLGDLAKDCVTSDVFVPTFPNITKADALLYVQDYYMMQYTCNDGFNDAMKYFYCMEEIGFYHPSKMEECSETEQQQIANGGGCSVYDNFVTCMSNVFIEYCGADIRNYICNLEVKGIVGANSQCATKPAPGTFAQT